VSRPLAVNTHGDMPREAVVAVTDVHGARHYVLAFDLESGTRTRLTRYHASGKLMGTLDRRARTWTHADPIHRGNIRG
jgi:YD repeat-containing protein